MATDEQSALLARITAKKVADGNVSAWWLGGSGFVFKTPGGAQIFVDPYLSDIVREIFGQGRAFPAPLDATEVRPDVVISTHWHEDHLDPAAIPQVAKNSPQTQFVMPPSAMARALSWGVPRSRVTTIAAGETLEIAGVSITGTPARHDAGIPGWEVPDAVGIVLQSGGVKIYHSGDSDYDARLRALKNQQLDLAIACINGVTGNMNAHEAALLVWQLGAKAVMPMHHLLWEGYPGGPDATLDPQLFADTYRNLGGRGEVLLPQVGELFELHRA
ncbi:MAG: MBL fold metallo-hydrolase [Abditibacteriaceae bacterium]